MSTLRSFVTKEARHILRDRRTLSVLLLMPVAMVLLFGFAIRTDVTNVRTVIVDPSRDVRSVELAQAISSTPALRLVGVLSSITEVEGLLQSGKADVALILPTQFARRLRRANVEVLIVSDGSNPNYAATAESYVRAVFLEWLPPEARGPQLIRTATRMRFNPTLASENLFVPGLLAYVLTLVSALMTAISIAREKETGTMEVLLVSPLRPIQIVVGKVAPYLALAFFNAVTTLIVAWSVFGVPIRGSVALLLATCLVYVLLSLALGVLISSRAPDQRTAMMATLLGLLLPTLALSGFVFPVASLPGWLQPVTNVVPATWFIIIARGIMLKGLGVAFLWKEFVVMCGLTVVLLAASAHSLHDRLD